MATPINAVLYALVAATFWSVLGYAIARHLLPRVLALGAAPVIGGGVLRGAGLPILTLIGFSAITVTALGIVGLGLAGIGLQRALAALEPPIDPKWLAAAAIAAAILALAPALALLPKYS